MRELCLQPVAARKPQGARRFVEVAHRSVVQRAVGLANARAGVRHGDCCETRLLQRLQPRNPRLVFAHTGVVEHAEPGLRSQGVARRTQAAMGSADRNAARVMRPQLGDGIDQTQRSPLSV